MQGARKKDYQRPTAVTAVKCPGCGASNPVRAYCCITCFKVLRAKVEVPFWKMQIHPSTSFTIFMLGVAAFLIYFVVMWMRDIEAQVTMNLNSGDYSLSVVADKRKAQGINMDVESGSTPAEAPSSENTPQ